MTCHTARIAPDIVRTCALWLHNETLGDNASLPGVDLGFGPGDGRTILTVEPAPIRPDRWRCQHHQLTTVEDVGEGPALAGFDHRFVKAYDSVDQIIASGRTV